MKRITNEEFIERARVIHENKYDYSLTNYINAKSKVIIICPEHGEFKQNSCSHLRGYGCSKCSQKYMDNDYFIIKASIKHNNKYNYILGEYTTTQQKIKIICPTHGIFEQQMNNHLMGGGCPKCWRLKKNDNEFISEAKLVHGNKYDYSLINYAGSQQTVTIGCKEHGNFEQIATTHLQGSGCPKCAIILRNNNITYTTNQFIEKSKQIHGNKYDYSLVNYVKNNKNVTIICSTHGIFEQKPNSHIQGSGCPICKQSKGEAKIIKILTKNNINYTYQKGFDDCKNINKLSFDFYLMDFNTCIEYDGKQHYESNEFFGGIESLKLQQEKDKIKNEYCLKNNIKLIRIKYNENIEDKLEFLINPK